MKSPRKMFVYKLIALAASLFVAVQLSAFAITPDITERAIVTMLGLDSTEGGIRMSARILVPVSGETEFTEISCDAEGESILEVAEQFLVLKGRKIEFAQCAILVFGSEMLDRGILQEAKTLYASGLLSPGVVTITTKGTAAEFVKTAAGFGSETSEDIAKFLVRFQESTAMPALSLGSYLDGELSESHAAFIPIVKLTSQQEEGDEDAMAVIESVATACVLKGGKRVFDLDESQTRGLTLTLNGSKKGNYRTEAFKINDEEFAPVKGAVRYKSVRIKTDFVSGVPRIRYTLKMKIEVEPNVQTAESSNKIELYRAIGKEFEASIQKDIVSAFAAAKQNDADFFLTHARFYRKNANEIQSYDADTANSFLRDVIVEVDVSVKTF